MKIASHKAAVMAERINSVSGVQLLFMYSSSLKCQVSAKLSGGGMIYSFIPIPNKQIRSGNIH